jgi:GxxExxY protein
MGMSRQSFFDSHVSQRLMSDYDFGAMTIAPARQRTALEVSKFVLDAAYRVHSTLGPGLLESAYQACLEEELKNRGIFVQVQVPVPVVYEGRKLEAGYRIDLLIENCVIVEIKSIEAIAPIHQAQTLSYLRLSGKSLALLINFNVVHLKDGIRRFVMGSDWK